MGGNARKAKKQSQATWGKEYKRRMDRVRNDPKNADDHLLKVCELFNKPPEKNYREVDL